MLFSGDTTELNNNTDTVLSVASATSDSQEMSCVISEENTSSMAGDSVVTSEEVHEPSTKPVQQNIEKKMKILTEHNPTTLSSNITPDVQLVLNSVVTSIVESKAYVTMTVLGKEDINEAAKNNPDTFPKPKNRIMCQCGSTNCRKFLF